MTDIAELAAYIDRPGIDKELADDIILRAPGLTLDEALQVQIAAKRRRIAAGDSLVGYQASFTSAAARKLAPDMPPPMVGSLLASVMRPSGAAVALDAEVTAVESEIGILLGRDLQGPNVTPLQALAAVEAYFPAIEIAPIRPGLVEGKWSNQHLIAVQKAVGGFIVTGQNLTPAGLLDPRLEGVVVSIDGEARASATGVEAMGSPLNVLAAVANRLAAAGEYLRAGQIVLTGSLPPPIMVRAGCRSAGVEFTRLGRVTVRFDN